MTTLAPIRTARLTLRPLCAADATAVFRVLSCPITTAQVSWRQHTLEAADAWLHRRIRDEAEHGYSLWGVEKAGALIGFCGFFPSSQADLELGYVIHHEHQGQGFASEAAIVVVEAARRRSLSVFATIRPANRASIRVSEKAGLRRTGEVISARPDLVVFRSPPAEA